MNFNLEIEGTILEIFGMEINLRNVMILVSSLAMFILFSIFLNRKLTSPKQRVLILTETAILAGLGIIFDALANYLQVGLFPQGGSISLASLPIFVIAYRRGLAPGLFCGLLVGTLQIIFSNFYYYTFIQFLLDYPVAYMSIGFAGFFTKGMQSKYFGVSITSIVIGTLVGGGLRFLSHFIAGVVFFSEWAPEGFNGVTWSLYYNITYMGPNIIISLIFLIIFKLFYTAILEPNA